MDMAILNKNYSAFDGLPVVETKNSYSCIDAGSTQTRSIVFMAKDLKLKNFNVISTDTAAIQLTRRIPATVRTSKAIVDNLECEIESQGYRWHFVKGTMRNVLTQDSNGLISNTSKVDQDLLYQSVLFQLALSFFIKDIEQGTSAQVYRTNLYLALPPEDFVQDRIDKTTNMLTGTHIVKFPRMKKEFTICITSVNLYPEPEAVANRYFNANAVNNDTTVFLDCGGRSKGALIVKKGQIIQDAIITDFGGGENMLNTIASIVADEYNITTPSSQTILDSLSTGFFKIGNEDKDITDEINDAKLELANSCIAAINRVLDASHTKIEEVQRVVCTGRTFYKTIRNENGNSVVISPSLLDFITDSFKKQNNIKITFEYYTDKDDNPIVKGLWTYALQDAVEDIKGGKF